MQLIQISRLPHRQVGANFTLEFQRTSGHYLWLDDLAISFSPFFPRRKNRSLQSLVGSASSDTTSCPPAIKGPTGPSALSPLSSRAHSRQAHALAARRVQTRRGVDALAFTRTGERAKRGVHLHAKAPAALDRSGAFLHFRGSIRSSHSPSRVRDRRAIPLSL